MLRYDVSELNYLQLNRESKSLDVSGCRQSVRLAILSDSAPQYLTPLFKTLLAKNGVRAEIYEAEFDTFESEILDPSSKLYAFKPDRVVLMHSVFALREKYHSSPDRAHFAQERASRLAALWSALAKHTDAAVIQANFILPSERLFGNFETRAGKSFYRSVDELNRLLADAARAHKGVFISDMDRVAAYYGRKNWLDEKLWVLCKAFCALDFLPHAVQNAVDVVLALGGAGVKCVVLDLDNTLWGGVIGDDGMEGIRLGHLGEGEAYTAFQHFLLDLKKRGVLLAVCSKNDPETAKKVFREHPEMTLREKDITVFLANWSNKAENLKAIRETLNISFGAMAFVDDNPFERNLVRGELPEIIVPEMPEDAALFVEYLSELNLFETASYSELDAERVELYRVEAERKLLEKQFATPEEYLKSLEMRMELKRFDAFHLPRIAQLLQRSNQFNLLTRRFTESQCEAFMRDEKDCLPLYLKLRDKYGDSGLISIVVAKANGTALKIEEWVMSCRVLARGVEQAAMNRVFEFAAKKGLKAVKGRYEPTDKNGMVKDFYGRFGFKKTENADGSIDWALETASYRPQAHFIGIETEEGACSAKK